MITTDLKPTDLRYDAAGIYVKEQFIASDNPRLAFAKQLAEIPDYGHMYGREGSWVHSRVMYDPRFVKIGLNCIIGGAGFGYERDEDGKLWPIPHHGFVVLENGVEIHNNVCIDRGVLGATVVGAGTRIDNLVHIAHGAVIGGSSEIGDCCFIGINASIKNKVKIGSGVTVGMGAVITKDVPDGVTVIGVNKILC